MDIFKLSERLMAMDNEVWARHANPWNVYSRFTCLPLVTVAIWSRVWLGWWALLPVTLGLFWAFYNPRAFAPSELNDLRGREASVFFWIADACPSRLIMRLWLRS